MMAYRTMPCRGARQRTLSWISTVLVLGLSACGSLSTLDSAGQECPASGCFADAAVDAKGPSPDVNNPEPDSAVTPNPLCGTGCDPDQSKACEDVEPDADGGQYADGAADGGPSPLDAGTSDGGKAADSSGGNMGGEFGASAAPNGEDAGGVPGPAFGCQVSWPAQTVVASCAATGKGAVNDPCSRSTDCAAGLTCVGSLSIGKCLKYCCLGNTNCTAAGFYCSDEVARDYLADNPSSDPSDWRKVPVCIPGRACDPVDPQNDPNKCENGLSCAIVKSDGTTGCVSLPSDAAKDGGSCKDTACAEGFVCAKTTNTCMKLCHVVSSTDECAGGVCQGGSTNLPAGFGICVASPDK
jgi:hypothetical protein